MVCKGLEEKKLIVCKQKPIEPTNKLFNSYTPYPNQQKTNNIVVF